jgi:predicted nucleotidyltransferase
VLEELIKNVAQALDSHSIPYMVIGGQAVLVYGRPRLTRDIDITLGIDVDEFALIEHVSTTLKLKILTPDAQNFAAKTRVLPTEEPESNFRVDFIFSFSNYERQALQRATQVMIKGYPIRFASCEDLVIHKMVAGRAIDEEDVKSVLARNRDNLDLTYVRRWLSAFGETDEHQNIVKRFEDLLATVQQE